jgi:hypothetical protein
MIKKMRASAHRESTVTKRREFIQSLPVASDRPSPAAVWFSMKALYWAKEAAPLKGHFYLKSRVPPRFTIDAVKQAAATLPFADGRDFEEQKKGLIAPHEKLKDHGRRRPVGGGHGAVSLSRRVRRIR